MVFTIFVRHSFESLKKPCFDFQYDRKSAFEGAFLVCKTLFDVCTSHKLNKAFMQIAASGVGLDKTTSFRKNEGIKAKNCVIWFFCRTSWVE